LIYLAFFRLGLAAFRVRVTDAPIIVPRGRGIGFRRLPFEVCRLSLLSLSSVP
jgi:hypothetical protein